MLHKTGIVRGDFVKKSFNTPCLAKPSTKRIAWKKRRRGFTNTWVTNESRRALRSFKVTCSVNPPLCEVSSKPRQAFKLRLFVVTMLVHPVTFSCSRMKAFVLCDHKLELLPSAKNVLKQYFFFCRFFAHLLKFPICFIVHRELLLALSESSRFWFDWLL